MAVRRVVTVILGALLLALCSMVMLGANDPLIDESVGLTALSNDPIIIGPIDPPFPIRPFPKPFPRPWPFPHPVPPLPLPVPAPIPTPDPGPEPGDTGGLPGPGREGDPEWGNSYGFVPLGDGNSIGWLQVIGTYAETGELAVQLVNPTNEPIRGGLQVLVGLAYTLGWFPDDVTEFAAGEYVPVDLAPGESELHILGHVRQSGLDLMAGILETLYTGYDDPEPDTDYACLGLLTATSDGKWVPWENLYVPVIEEYVDPSN
jgi:hypothetical protein